MSRPIKKWRVHLTKDDVLRIWYKGAAMGSVSMNKVAQLLVIDKTIEALEKADVPLNAVPSFIQERINKEGKKFEGLRAEKPESDRNTPPI